MKETCGQRKVSSSPTWIQVYVRIQYMIFKKAFDITGEIKNYSINSIGTTDFTRKNKK